MLSVAAVQARLTEAEVTAVLCSALGAVGGTVSVAGSTVEAVTAALCGPVLPRLSLARTASVYEVAGARPETRTLVEAEVASTVEPLSTSYEATGKSPAVAAGQLSARVCAVDSVTCGVPGAVGRTSELPSHLSPLIRQPVGVPIGPFATNQKLYGSVVPCAATLAL